MRAINLRTEHMINPIGIDSKEPYLSWNCEDGRRQTAYQIVAMDENGVVWDSSRVESDSMHASCPFELKSRQRIFWKIRLWDEKKEAGEWSAEAFFEMGLSDKADWRAKWINPELECDPEAHKPASVSYCFGNFSNAPRQIPFSHTT